MVKAETERKRELLIENLRSRNTEQHESWLELLCRFFANGKDKLPDGNIVDSERIIAQIVGKYRKQLGIRDGEMYVDLRLIMKAAEERGKHAGAESQSGSKGTGKSNSKKR